MGKKRSRAKKVSKGLRPTINSWVIKACRSDDTKMAYDKLEAWISGKNPWMTVANPNKNETNKRFIRVRADKYFGGAYKELKSRFKREREGIEATI